MKLTSIDFMTVAGAPSAILTSTRPAYAYENGKPTKQEGTTFTVACFGNEFQQISVKILGLMEPPISNEEISARNTAKQFVYCAFENFTGRLYQRRDDHSMQVLATASKIILQGGEGK